jgi:tetratricopeptide (TPR) repeat protein
MYWDGSRSNLDGADSYSRKALELDEGLAEAHVARGLAVSLSKGYREAEAEFTTAIRLDPRLFEAHYFFGRACFQQGKYVEAVEHYEEASRVRPEDYQTPLLLTSSLKSLGRDAEAAAAMRHGLHLAERHLELNPEDARALYLGGGALIQLGERERALEWATRAMVIDPGDSAVLYNVACVYALGGLVDEALSALEQSTQNGFGHKAWIENDSDLDNIRGNPRFTALLQKL